MRIAQAARRQKWTNLPFVNSPVRRIQCSITAQKVKSTLLPPTLRSGHTYTQAAHRVKAPGQASIAALLLLMSLLFIMGACSRSSRPAPGPLDPLEPYRAAMKDAYQGDIDLAATAPRYQISVTLPPPGDVLTGTARIDLTNTSPDPWQHLVFRLYPMLDQYRGIMTPLSALVNDSPTPFIYQAKDTAIRVDLPQALLPGQAVAVELSWKLTIPTWSNDSTTYALFGTSQDITSLPLFYPSLAV